MVLPTRDAIESYMSITGASESLAIQRLEEHGNNLTEAVNGHFRDIERSILDPNFDSRSEYNVVENNNQVRPDYNVVEDNNQVRGNESRPVASVLPSLLSAARSFRPSLLLDPSYRRNILRQLSGSAGSPPPSSHTGEVTGFPAHSTWGNDQIRPPALGEVGDGFARHSPRYGSQVHGETHRDLESPVYSNDAEEEMIRAAIEASKKDFQEGHHTTRYPLSNDSSNVLSSREVINREDEDIARAISMSIEMEEQESALREQLAEFMPHSLEHHDPCQSNTNESSRYKSVQDKREDVKQKQPTDTSSQHGHDLQNVEASSSVEWGGIPSKELQEAIMLEKALFSGIAKESSSHNNQPGIHMESQSPNKTVIGEEPEISSPMEKAMLPIEPSVENEDAITLLVRMPDSSRHGRRFLKSNKLKYLFDFIDAAGLVKPGTYRVVRPYPRRAFSLQDSALTFEELSLTNKQEALFLELM